MTLRVDRYRRSPLAGEPDPNQVGGPDCFALDHRPRPFDQASPPLGRVLDRSAVGQVTGVQSADAVRQDLAAHGDRAGLDPAGAEVDRQDPGLGHSQALASVGATSYIASSAAVNRVLSCLLYTSPSPRD